MNQEKEHISHSVPFPSIDWAVWLIATIMICHREKKGVTQGQLVIDPPPTVPRQQRDT